MFHQLVLLSDGKVCSSLITKYTYYWMDTLFQVSYHDVPDRAYETFVSALTSKCLEQGLVVPTLVDVHNPAGNLQLTLFFCKCIYNRFSDADVIMDMLGSPKMRQIITESYQNSGEPKLITRAIMRAR